tara:strand:+ start:301 stop:510 length:210 start_codon:yes stop_codon:yes gene_type:complete
VLPDLFFSQQHFIYVINHSLASVGEFIEGITFMGGITPQVYPSPLLKFIEPPSLIKSSVLVDGKELNAV